MVTLILAAAVPGCGGPEAREPAQTAPPPGVSVSLAQWRSDEADHRLEVAVSNATDTPIRFSRVQLVTGSFATLPPYPVDTVLGRTPRTDLRIPYGEAVCPDDRIPSVRPAAVLADARVGDGPERRIRFDLPHPDPLLTRLVNEECGAHLLRRKVNITFGDSWRPTRVKGVEGMDAMVGTLHIVRGVGSEEIEIADLGNTTHFTLRAMSGRTRPVVVLPAGRSRLDLPVMLYPSRCDPHAFAEAKKAYLFPIRASAGGGEPLLLIASPSREMQLTFTNYARKACGLPGS
ncbi:hypothetical protein AB0K60_23515 [Thermopolyspora sp. NPDC052614]|uniref:hypothetical protein n=1 Tax=Thermopolyspora sp. NPDC052614 TaxID=3155682 RepID=UPI003443B817